MNKKAQSTISNIIVFGLLLVLVMGIALAVGLGGASIKVMSDQITPGLSNFQETDSLDLGDIADTVITPWNAVMNALPWILGALYMIALVGMLGVAYGYRISGQRFLIVLYFLIAILVIFGSIMISNTYETFYKGGGLVGAELQGMILLSWLMLYSPVVMTIISFIAGAIIFSGFEEVEV